MAVSVEFQAGRAEAGQQEPLVRIRAYPDEGRLRKLRSPVD